MPANIVLPHVVYHDLSSATDWLKKAFGFAEYYRYGDEPMGAMMRLGDAYVMVRSSRENSDSPARLGKSTQSLTIFVDDVDAHYRATKSAGAKIVEELHETEYGELQYGVEDLEGHHWLFSRHARDVDPADWGATVTGR